VVAVSLSWLSPFAPEAIALSFLTMNTPLAQRG
jgi:hypothetical protein